MIITELLLEEKPILYNVIRDLRSTLCGVMHPNMVDAIIAESVRNSHDA